MKKHHPLHCQLPVRSWSCWFTAVPHQSLKKGLEMQKSAEMLLDALAAFKRFQGLLAALLCPDGSRAELFLGDTLPPLWPQVGKQRLLGSTQLGVKAQESLPMYCGLFFSRNSGSGQMAWQPVLLYLRACSLTVKSCPNTVAPSRGIPAEY